MNVEIAYITETSSFEKVRQSMAHSTVLGIDTETTGFDPYTKRLRTLQISTVSETFVLDVWKLGEDNVREALLELFMDAGKIKVFHNAKFDLKFLHIHLGFPLFMPSVFDTMVADVLITGGMRTALGARTPHDLGACSERYLNRPLDKRFQKVPWDGTLFKEQLIYAGLDAAVLLPMYRVLANNLTANQLEQVALLEFECIPCTAHIELSGIHLHKPTWLKAAEKFAALLVEPGKLLRKVLGDLNFASPLQVQKAFDTRLGVRVPSVSKDVLKPIIDNYRPVKDMFGQYPPHNVAEIMSLYLEYTGNLKKATAYGPKFFKHINSTTGRVHASFNQNEADTGRYSCSEPNLQQIPHIPEYRNAFIADEGNSLIDKDYSQVELRIIADTARIRRWLEAFANGDDLHDVTKNEIGSDRYQAKIVNFSSAYGAGAQSYALKANIALSLAQQRMRKFYKSIPEFSVWLDRQVDYLKQYNLVRSASGRMRVLNRWMWNDDEMHIAKQASRNFPIQATSADILKTALVKLIPALPAGAKVVNIVHDEVLTEAPDELVPEVSALMDEAMIYAGKKFVERVDIKVDTNISKRWEKE